MLAGERDGFVHACPERGGDSEDALALGPVLLKLVAQFSFFCTMLVSFLSIVR